MPRNYRLHLNDILTAIARIEQLMQGLTEDEFTAYDVRVDGILFNLMTIGEAVKNLPQEIREQASDIRWRDISRFRDRLVHHYYSIDLNIIWEILVEHLPVMQAYVEELINNLENDTDS